VPHETSESVQEYPNIGVQLLETLRMWPQLPPDGSLVPGNQMMRSNANVVMRRECALPGGGEMRVEQWMANVDDPTSLDCFIVIRNPAGFAVDTLNETERNYDIHRYRVVSQGASTRIDVGAGPTVSQPTSADLDLLIRSLDVVAAQLRSRPT
jgi:hypothetical protein